MSGRRNVRLPGIGDLEAFVAAAELGSFVEAGNRLGVSPSAISHRIGHLEDQLGASLFSRNARQLELTHAGATYLPAIRDALARLDAATRELAEPSHVQHLIISSAPAFAVGWLMPRLGAFQLEHPEIEVRLTSSFEVVDLDRSDVDVAIRYTRNDQGRHLRMDRLLREELVPICTPALRHGPPPLRDLTDLANVTLLHSLTRVGQWRSWLQSAGVYAVDSERGMTLQNDSMAVEAALAGLGVAIVTRHLVDHHLESGRLIVPFSVEVPNEAAFYLVYPKVRSEEPKIRSFREWVLGEIEQERTHGDADPAVRSRLS